MTVTVSGNHGRGFKGDAAGGVGMVSDPVGLGWAAISASAISDKWVVQLSSIIMSQLAQGVFFQSEVAATVEFTLCNPSMATSLDPAENNQTKWGNSLTLSPSTIVKAPVLFTACRITFGAPGTVYIGAR